MTPIQEAMCETIKKHGCGGLLRSIGGLPVRVWREGVIDEQCTGYWVIDIDGHTLTQQEYEQWVEQQNSKS